MSPVFAGRGDELSVLTDAFMVAASGTPRIVLLGAEAGGVSPGWQLSSPDG